MVWWIDERGVRRSWTVLARAHARRRHRPQINALPSRERTGARLIAPIERG